MKKDIFLIVGAVVLLGGAAGILLFLSSSNQDTHHHDDSMADHSKHMEHMTVSSEREFIEAMILHHQEAVDTAREVLERGGTTEEIRTLATNIISSQEKEIADMKRWYENWYGQPYADTGTYTPMMRELASLNGTELDKVFLTDMIMHHRGAIMMARSVEIYVTHDELSKLTKDIIRTQSEEIEVMEHLLSHL
jgi:uncharacterized protein (DUF305 family)